MKPIVERGAKPKLISEVIWGYALYKFNSKVVDDKETELSAALANNNNKKKTDMMMYMYST